MSTPHSSVFFKDKYGAENQLGSALVRNCPKCNKGISKNNDNICHISDLHLSLHQREWGNGLAYNQ